GISVAEKEYPVCGNIVRFQDYTSGFHNFNNNVLLTLPLCELLLSGLANKSTSGQMLETLSFFNDNRYHHQTVRKAFHHFLSLTNFKFDFSCYQCGHHPPVIIADANWKLAFDIPLGIFKRPNPDDISDKELEVDIVKAWSDVDKSIIADALISGTTVVNPFSTSTHHSTLAPWMGQHTRVGNVLPGQHHTYNERDKRRHTFGTHLIQKDCQHSKKDLQNACLSLGVSSEGTIAELINRLQELLCFKDVYPKLFLKLQKAGVEGGVLHLSCMHGVVYYVNFLFWMESARDHAD
uniref:HMG domain-containing protein n=1 Tax=Poecilia formosa TaxID=48698 RepID=A0A096MFA4_POEFO